MIIGAFLSIFFTSKIASLVRGYNRSSRRFIYYGFAAMIGVISPICMYGTVPIIAALHKKKVGEPILVAFMVGSILLNPNLIILTMVLGIRITVVRVIAAILGGQIAGCLVDLYLSKSKTKKFYKTLDFEYHSKSALIKNPVHRYFYGLHRTLVKTVPYFLTGIAITVLIELYLPFDLLTTLFMKNSGLSILFATMLGVPLYACGGGTIPILNALLGHGLSIGAAIAFMMSGPMTKINNIGAVKMILGVRHFIYYIVFAISYALLSGVVINILLN